MFINTMIQGKAKQLNYSLMVRLTFINVQFFEKLDLLKISLLVDKSISCIFLDKIET